MMETVILVVVVIAAVLIYTLPLIAGIYMERQDRQKRGEPDTSKARYDERQQLIRLKACTHAFYVLMGYLLIWLVLELMGVLHWKSRTFQLLSGGLMLALTTANGECILRGAMLGYNQSKNESSQIAMYFIIGVCWTLMGRANLDGALNGSLGVMQLLLGINYLMMGVLMLYARRRRRLAERGADPEDGEG